MTSQNINDPFFQGGQYGGSTTMEASGLFVTFNMPKATDSKFGAGGDEFAQSLPPYAPRAAFLVDDYPASPEQWLRSTNDQMSYMVAVREGYGCWLDFNQCASHAHDVAIVVSTQGVNAISALKADTLRLEQYKERCPKHDAPLGANRRCEQCGFNWPHQNYLATTGQPGGTMWLDGFRTADGTVRQWVFTEDGNRSVAKAIIGDERVHALGVAFFLSKEPKPRPVYRDYGPRVYGGLESATFGGGFATRGMSAGATRGGYSARNFEVAAGAKINQRIHQDPKSLDYWQEKPAGIIIINYTDVETLRAVIAAGKRASNPEGALGNLGIPLGHHPQS